MHYSYLFLIVTVILVSGRFAHSLEKVRFEDLLKQMLMSNEFIIARKSLKNEEEVDDETSRRFNAPELTVSLTQSTAALSQDLPTEFSTDLEVFESAVGISGSLPMLGLGYNLSYTQSDQEQNSYSTEPRYMVDGQAYSLGVQINLLEDAGFLVGDVLFANERVEYEVAKSGLEQQIQQSTLELIRRYLNARLFQRQIKSTQRFQAQARNLFGKYRALYKEGKISKVELLSAKIQMNNQQVSIMNLEAEYKRSRRQLFEFVGGIDVGKIEQESSFDPIRLKSIKRDPVPNKQRQLSSNPDIRLIQSEVKLSSLRLRSLANKVLPTFDLSGGVSRIENPRVEPLAGTEGASDQWSVGLSFSLPLDNVAAKGNLKREEIRNRFLEVRQTALRNNIEMASASLVREIKVVRSQLKITNENLRLAQQRYKSALPLIRKSSSAGIDIFFYQNEMISIEYRKIELEVILLTRRAELLYLNGELGLHETLNSRK